MCLEIDIFDTSTVGQIVTASNSSDPNSPRLLTYGDHILSLTGNATTGYTSAPFSITSTYNPSGGSETSTAVIKITLDTGPGVWVASIQFTDSFGLWTGPAFSSSGGGSILGSYSSLYDVFACTTGGPFSAGFGSGFE